MPRLSSLVLIAVLVGCNETRLEPALAEKSAALTATVVIRRGTHTVADTFISERAQQVNFGNKKVLRVSHKKEALLRFDLSDIPPEAVIESAKLTLFVNGEDDDDDDCPDRRDHPVTVHRVKRAWDEHTVTYKSFDQRFESDVEATLQVTSNNAYKTLDLTQLVRAWVSGHEPNHGVLLKTSGRTRAVFVSSEHKHASQRPRLEIVYTTPDDHCAVEPCENGGVCVNGQDGFTCECAPGFTGRTCGDTIDQCAPNPCDNGGSCTADGHGFTCACAPGWSGLTCEINVDDCAPNPCDNGGVCTDRIAGFTCACPAGFDGERCENDIDECAGDPCQNGGACVEHILTFACVCPAGFAGSYCEIDIDDCVANDCQNGATCIDAVAGYSCACAPGYAGALCEANPDDCDTNPCLNGGTCGDGLADYTCECAPGYGGINCEVDLDECAAAPCVNGQCLDLVDAYECLCKGHWVGTNCDTCPTGFTGPDCQPIQCQPGELLVGDRCEPNRAPSLASVELSPASPNVGSVLICTPGPSSDADGDPVSFTYRWLLGTAPGTPVANQTGSTLSGAFAKGDVIRCEVTPRDPYGAGTPVSSPAVTIQNSPPTLTGLTLAPDPASPCATFTCTPGAVVDPDIADTHTVTYRWTVDDLPVAHTASSWSPVDLIPGHRVRCYASASDGDAPSPELPSNEVMTTNTPPTLAAVSIEPSPTAQIGSTLTCSPSDYTDPECAPTPSYTWRWLRNGEPLETSTATLSTAGLAVGDSVSCEATPYDQWTAGGPRQSDPVTLTNNAPSTPVVLVTAPSGPAGPVTCELAVPSFDTGPLSYTWHWQLGAEPSFTGPQILDRATTDCDLVRCWVTVTDGYASVSSDASELALPFGPACDDHNECTDDSCAPAGGCQHTNHTRSCADSDLCNGHETCQDGACQPGLTVACDGVTDPCLESTCNPATGACDLPRPDGTSCDDGASCTWNDACESGVCVAETICGCDLTTGLLLWYDFETSLQDKSGQGRHATPSKTATYANSLVGRGLVFDGGQHLTVQSGKVLGPTTSRSRTIAFWAKPTTRGTAVINQYENYNANNSSFFIAPSGAPSWQITGNGTNVLESSVGPLDTWEHIAVVFMAGTNQTVIYRNGAEAARGTLNYPVAQSTRDTKVGEGLGLLGNYRGTLDELRVYDRALSADDIATLAATSCNPAPPDCVCPSGWTGPSCGERITACASLHLGDRLFHRAPLTGPVPTTIWIGFQAISKGIQNAGVIIDNARIVDTSTQIQLLSDPFDVAANWLTRSGAIGQAKVESGQGFITADWGGFERTGPGTAVASGHFSVQFDTYWGPNTDGVQIVIHRSNTRLPTWDDAWLWGAIGLGQYGSGGRDAAAIFALDPGGQSPIVADSSTPITQAPTVGWHVLSLRVTPGACDASNPPEADPGTCEPSSPSACKAIELANPSAPSGVYPVDVDGNGPLPEVSAWCDLTTDGGGWTRVFGHRITTSTHTVPTPHGDIAQGLMAASTESGYVAPAQLAALMTKLGATELRLTCGKPAHPRVIDIKTQNTSVLAWLTGQSNTQPLATGSFTRLPADTALLTQQPGQWGWDGQSFRVGRWGHVAAQPANRLVDHPMFIETSHHWLLNADRSECDDWINAQSDPRGHWHIYVR